MLTKVQDFADHVREVTLALNDVDRRENLPLARAALELFRRGQFKQAHDTYNMPAPPEPVPEDPSTPRRTPRRRRTPTMSFGPIDIRLRPGLLSLGRGGVVQWMMKRPRAFAGTASVVVVSTAGLQLQYLNNAGFSGSLGDWMSLVLWSAVIELSGVSVLDVLGRLGGGARTVGASPPGPAGGGRGSGSSL
jgi:hypothetical protein